MAPLTLPSPETHPLHTELVHNFRAACQIIHNTFQVSLRGQEEVKQRHKDGQPKPWLVKSMVAVREQTMLFQWSPGHAKKFKDGSTSSLLSYWVCGRLFLGVNARECYVCYHESAPQEMVELAFRLAQGRLG